MEKALLMLVADAFNTTHSVFDPDMSVLGFTTTHSVDLNALNGTLAQHTLRANGLHCFGQDGQVIRYGVLPFPIFMDTGNELEDHARYDREKEAWIRSNAREYAEMNPGESQDQ